MNGDAFIGKGWKFPPSFNKATYSTVMVSGVQDISESLWVLFSTMQGERVMLPDYGSPLWSMIFENESNSFINLMKAKLSQAILYYEPRIVIETINIRQSKETSGLILIDLAYVISESNERANMVYPFYVAEGTNIPSRY